MAEAAAAPPSAPGAPPTTTTTTAPPTAGASGDLPAAAAGAVSQETAPATPAAPATDKAATPPVADSILADKAETAKPGEVEAKEGQAKEGEQAAEEPPIAYTEFTLPEGFTADEKAMEAFKDLAATMKLPQEAAQQFVDMYAAKVAEIAAQPYQAWVALQAEWTNAIKADPVFGGANLKGANEGIVKALDGYGDGGKLRQALEVTGAINNPEIYRVFHRWSQSATEGPLVPASQAGTTPKNPADVLYGKKET